MQTSARLRMARSAAALFLALSVLLPAAAPAAAADPLVLRVGTTQDLDSMNPFQTALVVGFEAFTLNYQLLLGFDAKLEPKPEFAEFVDQVRRRADLHVQDQSGQEVVRWDAGNGR